MQVNVDITIKEITSNDMQHLDDRGNFIIEQALEVAGMAILQLEELHWQRFIGYCHTGRFD